MEYYSVEMNSDCLLHALAMMTPVAWYYIPGKIKYHRGHPRITMKVARLDLKF